MGFSIDDGGGKGFKAKVTDDGRLDTSSRSNPRIYYVSRDSGDAFTWTSIDPTSAAGAYSIYIKNDSTTHNLVINEITLGGVLTQLWKLHGVTGTAAGSSVVTAVNMNLSSGNTASATARGDGPITGLTSTGVIDALRCPAASHAEFKLDGSLILGKGDAIALEMDTGSESVTEISITGYFDKKPS